MKIFNKENGKKVVKKVAKGIGFVATTIGATSALITAIVLEDGKSKNDNQCSTGYYDAVQVITNSDMLDCNKQRALESLKRFSDDKYYKAIISIMQSDMLDCLKIEMIEQLG